MKVIESSMGNFVLSIRSDELILICNSLNEVLHGIDVFEFDTRLGASREEASELMADIKNALNK